MCSSIHSTCMRNQCFMKCNGRRNVLCVKMLEFLCRANECSLCYKWYDFREMLTAFMIELLAWVY
jgi:hypothetical protein